MTVKTASRWALITSAIMIPLLVTLAARSRERPLTLAMPVAIVVMTIGLEVRIARALHAIPENERGKDLPALLIHLLLLIPCIGLAGLLAAFD